MATTSKVSAAPVVASLAAKAMHEGTMDRLIWAAWRAFWVGLGASAVIVGQSLLAPAPAAEVTPPPAVAPAYESAPAKPKLQMKKYDAPAISAVEVASCVRESC